MIVTTTETIAGKKNRPDVGHGKGQHNPRTSHRA